MLPKQYQMTKFLIPFGESHGDEKLGDFVDRTIRFCGDIRLDWIPAPRICKQRVIRWIVIKEPTHRELKCPHCGAIACFAIIPKDSDEK